MFGFTKAFSGESPEGLGAYLQSLRHLGDARQDADMASFVAQRGLQSQTLSIALAGQPRWEESGSPASLEDIDRVYRARGTEFLANLSGGFALAIADTLRQRVLLAIDRMGIATLSWSMMGSVLVFSTSAFAVAQCPGMVGSIRRQALYDYFFFHMIPAPGSVFDNVNKLQAGELLTWTPDRIDRRRYWQPSFGNRHGQRFSDLAQGLHAAIDGAVAASRPDATTGAFLSGGLDSSTVAGFLCRQRPGADTFSIGFGVPEFDESRYARISGDHFGSSANEYQVQPRDVVAAIPVVAANYDEPFGNSSAIPTYLCARFAAERGMARLLAGDGGDELFGGNERYAKHKLFEWFWCLPQPIRGHLAATVQGTIADTNPVSALRKLRSYVDQALIPLPERFESWNFVYREGAQMMFEPDFVADIHRDGPMEQMRERFRCLGASDDGSKPDLLDSMLAYDWKFTLADNDLRKVTTMCRVAGVEVEFPMLDNQVVNLALRIPSAMKLKGLTLRHFYRKAMKGFLAKETLAKSKQGFGLPFGIWLKEHAELADLVFGSLSDLKQRRIIKPDFLDQLVEDHRSGHPGYYGYVIWDLVILEEWLKHHHKGRISL